MPVERIAFLRNAGEMGDRIARHPWHLTAVGAIASWPESMTSVVATILRSPVPIVTLWGEDGVMIYNDAYSIFAGARHPQLLGSKVREGWSEVADFNDNVMRSVLGGDQTLSYVDQELTLHRNGRPEHVWMNLDYSPVLDDRGERIGVVAIVVETTAKVTAERWQRGETERLRMMVEQTPGFSALLEGPSHIFAMANQAYLKLVGNREIIGKTVVEALPEVRSQGFIELLDRIYETGETISGETAPVSLENAKTGTGEIHYLDYAYQPVRDRSGQIAGVYVQGTDVTDRVLANKALQESEARFRLLAESAPVMLWMGDQQGKCVYLNRAQREFWGVPDDLAGFDWNNTLHPEDREALALPFTQGMRTRTGFTAEGRYRRADGEWRTLVTNSSPRFGADGEFVGMIGVNVDVTEQKEAEAEQQKEKRRLEILNSSGAAIAAELDLQKIVQTVTDAGVALAGAEFGAFFYNVLDRTGESYTLYSLSGVDHSHFDKFPMPRNTAIFRPTFEGSGIVRSADILLHPDFGKNEPIYGMPAGHLPVRSYLAVPVVSRTGSVIGGLFFGHREPDRFLEEHEKLLAGIAGQAAVAIDNASLFQTVERENRQRAKAEEDLRKLNETLEARISEEIAVRRQAEAALFQAQKMEALGQLTGGVAHDFNNLLMAVMGSLELMRKRMPADSQLLRLLDNAMEGARRGAALTARMLAFARRQELQIEPTNIATLFGGMVDLLQRSLGPMISIETSFPGALPPVRTDAAQLETALLNIVVNARDAMHEQGVIRITASEEVIGGNADLPPGRYVRLSVSDSGEGMDELTLQRAREPFFTTKGVGKGTGLGLSMVHGLAEQSGGRLFLKSEKGRGTTAEIVLPVAQDAVAEAPRVQPVEAETADPGALSILVVDDDPLVRLNTVAMLEELGHRVIEAQSGSEALDCVARQKIDIVITDHAMPRMSGVQLAETIQRDRPDFPILLATGYAELPEGEDSRLPRLAKPFTQAQLASMLATTLAGR